MLLLAAVALVIVAGAVVWLVIPTAPDDNRRSALAPPSPTAGATDPAAVDKPGATPAPPRTTGKPGVPAGPGEVAADESKHPSGTPSTNAPVDPATTPKADPTTTATRPPTTVATTKAPQGTILKSNGGEVTAHCNGAEKSKLLAWDPAPGWSVYNVAAGPDTTTSIVFKNGLSKTRMTVTCLAGTPHAVVLPL